MKNILLFTILALFTQCKKSDSKTLKETKNQQLFAENNYDFGGKVEFEMFSDSSYNFTLIDKGFNYEKTEKFNGHCYLIKDTIYFKPLEFNYTNSEKAVIKNNFIEFISKEKLFRIEIKKSALKIESQLDLAKFEDYAIFTYKPYDEDSDFQPYDINQMELKEIDMILNKCFTENKSKLRNKNEYLKQCIAVTNQNNEQEVWIHCYCKSPHADKSFKYNQIKMMDGGNCNISVKINLTKKEYSQLIIAGLA